MLRLLATTSLLVLLAQAPAWGQGQNPASSSPRAGQTSPEGATRLLNQQDQGFIRDAGIGGMAEVTLGKLAEQRAKADPVKDFARRMVQDHSKANDQLAALAKQHNIGMPKELDEEHRQVHDRLEKLSGAEFDRAYIESQVQDHQKTAQLFEWEINSGQNAQLKSFASETLPTILHHLEMARDIHTELSTEAPQAAAGSSAPAATSGTGAHPQQHRDGTPENGARTNELNRQRLQQPEGSRSR